VAWKSLGKDAVNKNTKPVSWEAREVDKKMVSFQAEYEFYERIKEHAEHHGLKLSQFIRYAVSKEMGRE